MSSELLLTLSIVLLLASAVFLLAGALYPDKLLAAIRQGNDPAAGRKRVASRRPWRTAGSIVISALGRYNRVLVRQRFRKRMQRRFTAMGRSDYRPEDFIAQQQVYGAFFLILGLMAMNLLQRPFVYALPFGVFGFFFPFIWLRDQILKRQRLIRRALPYHLDLLTLSVEAGLDFQQAMSTVTDKGQSGPLRDEFSLMLKELRLGKTRAEALRNLSERIQVAEVSNFVSNLVQADKMGTSLGKVLRVQSSQMRVMRSQRAEKLANEAPVKMLFPLIAFIFPTVFMILFGPIIYRLMFGG